MVAESIYSRSLDQSDSSFLYSGSDGKDLALSTSIELGDVHLIVPLVRSKYLCSTMQKFQELIQYFLATIDRVGLRYNTGHNKEIVKIYTPKYITRNNCKF